MKLNFKFISVTFILVLITTLSKLYFSTKLSWSGFSPIIAIALFAGMMVKDKSASFIMPLLSLFISDLIIEALYQFKLFPFQGLYGYQILNYTLLLFSTLIGFILKGKSYKALLGGAFAAPTLFFILSNFSLWVTQNNMYTHSFNGLLTCYIAAITFYAH